MAKLRIEKGGTVVPPSDFQSVTTESTNQQQVAKKNPRPHGSARAQAGDIPQSPTPDLAIKCNFSDCPYYGHAATYCQICTLRGKPLGSIEPLDLGQCLTIPCSACCCWDAGREICKHQ